MLQLPRGAHPHGASPGQKTGTQGSRFGVSGVGSFFFGGDGLGVSSKATQEDSLSFNCQVGFLEGGIPVSGNREDSPFIQLPSWLVVGCVYLALLAFLPCEWRVKTPFDTELLGK